MAKLQEIYEAIQRMIDEGRGESKVYFSDGSENYEFNMLSYDEELDSDIIASK